MSRFTRSLRWLLLCAFAATQVHAPPAHAGIVFTRPTDAPVLDPFRLPGGPFGAGNRGIEYATGEGDIITAPADGVVSFAGAVAGDLFVSIDHAGGLRTTAGFVAHTLVPAGATVTRGRAIAVADGPFHFTVRLDGVYVDPEPLFGRRRVRARLVPFEARPGRQPVPAGLTIGPATLFDGPFGPRPASDRVRWNHWVRATPGRLGVPHEHATGKEESPWQSSP